MQDLQRRNPWLTTLVRLSDDDLIDLYLRKEPDRDPEWEQRVRERSHFGLDPDKYIRGSERDTFMEFSTRFSIMVFMKHLIVDVCSIDWERPDDVEIEKLLTE